MNAKDIFSGKKLDKAVFENTIKGILYNVTPELVGDEKLYKRLKALIFLKNKTEPEKILLFEELKDYFLEYYNAEKAEDIVSLFSGMQKIIQQNDINDEATLDQWMARKKMKMKRKLFGGRKVKELQMR